MERRRTTYIRSTKDPHIFRLSFIDNGIRVVEKREFESSHEASKWLSRHLKIIDRKKANGN